MKILYTQGKVGVGILDEYNYVVYDTTKCKIREKDGKQHASYDYKYFKSPSKALVTAAQTIANKECKDLESWVLTFSGALEKMTIVCGIQ